ncbi:hypothetical protein B0H11DRAFT_1939205 [Mycena galericulata]|nr:hypothetical protein B0H11DRAFT_1939205 [Mycena galericulata]
MLTPSPLIAIAPGPDPDPEPHLQLPSRTHRTRVRIRIQLVSVRRRWARRMEYEGEDGDGDAKRDSNGGGSCVYADAAELTICSSSLVMDQHLRTLRLMHALSALVQMRVMGAYVRGVREAEGGDGERDDTANVAGENNKDAANGVDGGVDVVVDADTDAGKGVGEGKGGVQDGVDVDESVDAGEGATSSMATSASASAGGASAIPATEDEQSMSTTEEESDTSPTGDEHASSKTSRREGGPTRVKMGTGLRWQRREMGRRCAGNGTWERDEGFGEGLEGAEVQFGWEGREFGGGRITLRGSLGGSTMSEKEEEAG